MSQRHLRGGMTNGLAIIGISIAVIIALVLVLWQPWNNSAQDKIKLTFYCAAGMSKPVAEIVESYHNKYPNVEIQVNYGGTGKLLSTIKANQGAGQLYLAADKFHMHVAREEGYVAETIPIAHLRPVLVINKDKQQSLSEKVESVEDLVRPDLKVSLANPELAAIGKLTKDVLAKSETAKKIWEQIEADLKSSSNRVSTVGTVNEVAQAIETGAADVGIVWSAIAKQRPDLELVEIKEFANAKELVQIGILTKAEGEVATASLKFARFLSAKDAGLQTFETHSFSPIPDADLWVETPQINLSSGSMLKPGIKKIVAAFEKREGVKIDTTYNGCGILVAGMKASKKANDGKFPDAYFSCDVTFMDDVQQWFEPSVLVSRNDMVFIVQKGNPKNITELQDLAQNGLKVGLGHPENSALGGLTATLLKRSKLHDEIENPNRNPTVVHADAGHMLVNQVVTNALDVAIVYRSNAKADPINEKKHLDILPIKVIVDGKTLEAQAAQPFAVAKDSKHKYLMRRLLTQIVREETRERFKGLGFYWAYDKAD
ncbi:MAG: extracellular solute-binding protein [Gemmataceae bacterium]